MRFTHHVHVPFAEGTGKKPKNTIDIPFVVLLDPPHQEMLRLRHAGLSAVQAAKNMKMSLGRANNMMWEIYKELELDKVPKHLKLGLAILAYEREVHEPAERVKRGEAEDPNAGPEIEMTPEQEQEILVDIARYVAQGGRLPKGMK